MPLKRTYKKRTTRKTKSTSRRKTARRTRLPNRMTGNYGSAVETFSLSVTAGVSYNFSTALTDLVRAQVIAREYQHYRITGVEMRFKPQYDTFQAQLANTIPSLYWCLDKAGVLGSPSAPQFEQLGTKQVRLDDRIVVRKFKPGVVQGDATSSLASAMKTSPWIPIIDPATGGLNNPRHRGCAFLITKMSPGDVLGYDVDVVVHIQFKRPFVATNANTAIEPPRNPNGEVYGPPA